MIERDRIEALTELMVELEMDLDRSDLLSGRHRRGVALWVRIVIGLVALLALSNLYFVNDLTDEVRLVITRMQEMNQLFTRVSERMDQMSVEVNAIERNVFLMPVISEQMREMASHVQVIEQSVASMAQATGRLDNSVAVINTSVHEMAVRFHGLNQRVGAMGADVDQMARPLP
ncbi:hypothetical protein [Halochromatium salexigens]|uniref:Translation initiation factor 2 n=1 Tax=Halochromatium salexigens TaxID=49447 RepID=A0AAJ0XFD2_HALSE|nr:hypothetical protein [Halochromatium salexigens]MBK5930031.1 hypothetical protein [Halochromatium salexigens]